MDIKKINLNILNELSEAEKSRIRRILDTDDAFKLSSTISRYIETNPNFVRNFFNELIKDNDDNGLYIATCLPYYFFNEITAFLGHAIVYNLSLTSTYHFPQHADIMVKLFINNYNKFDENLKIKLMDSICSNEKTFYSLVSKISFDFEKTSQFYYKLSKETQELLLLRTVEKTAMLLNYVFKDLTEDLIEKSLNIIIQNNKIGLQTDYLIQLISTNFINFPESKKNFFIDKLFELANSTELFYYPNNNVFDELGNLFEQLDYDNFIKLLTIFVNKKGGLCFRFEKFINQIPDELRNKLIANQIPSKADIIAYENEYNKDYPMYEVSGNLEAIFSVLSKENFDKGIKYVLDNNIDINFIIETIAKNLSRLEPITRNYLFNQIIFDKINTDKLIYPLLKNLKNFPDTIDFFLKVVDYNKKSFNYQKNNFIKEFYNFDKDIKEKLLENKVTKKFSYSAITNSFNSLSEEEMKLIICKFKTNNDYFYLTKYFILNYKNFTEEFREYILKSFIEIKKTQKSVAKIIFENFNLISKNLLSNSLENLIESDDKKVKFYLSKIINDFHENIPINILEKLFSKALESQENTELFFKLIEKKLTENSDELIDLIFDLKLSISTIKKVAKKLFENINNLNDKTLNYLKYLSSDEQNSSYIVWYFIYYFNTISEPTRTEFLSIFTNTKNLITIERLLLELLNNKEIPSSLKNDLLFKISEKKSFSLPVTKVLVKNFNKLDKNLRTELLTKISITDSSILVLLDFLIKNNDVSITLKKEILTKILNYLDSSKIFENTHYINLKRISDKIKKNFSTLPDDIKTEVIKILFKNYYSRKTAVNIITNYSKELSNDINSLLFTPIEESNLIIPEIAKISREIKEKIIKSIIEKIEYIYILKDVNEIGSEIWIKNKILKYEKIYHNQFKKITKEIILKDLVRLYSELSFFDQNSFSFNLNRYTSETGIANSFELQKLENLDNIALYDLGLNNLFLDIAMSKNYNELLTKELNLEKNLNEEHEFLPLKIFSNLKSINIIASKLRWDFYKFNQDTSNKLLLLFVNYKYTYLAMFISDTIKYNHSQIYQDILEKVIKNLKTKGKWGERMAKNLEELK